MELVGRNMPLRFLTGVVLTLMFFDPSDAKSAPANSLRELYTAVGECVQMPTDAAGSEITIVFSIKRDGSLFGKPRISHAKLLGDTNAQKRFVGDIFLALEKCLPINITTGLGGAVAGRPLSFRIIGRLREINT